jgi:hypothetical protein
MHRKLFAVVAGCIAALTVFKAAAVPLQIPLNEDPFPFDDGHLGVVISNTVAQFLKSQNLPPSLAMTNLAPVKVTQDADAPGGYPGFGAETLGIEIPSDDYNFVFMLWGSGRGGVGMLWHLDGDGSFSFESPTGDYLNFYSLYGAKDRSAVPDGASTALLLALGCGAVLTAARRYPRFAGSRS